MWSQEAGNKVLSGWSPITSLVTPMVLVYLLASLLPSCRASLVAQLVKTLPAMQETQIRFLGWEDPLEKEVATHSSILAYKMPVDRGAWQAIVHGVTRVRHDLATKPPPPPHLAQICRIVMPQCECQHLPSHVSGRREPSPWYFTCMTTWPMNWSSTLRSSSNFFCLIKMCFQGNLKTC